MARAKTTDELSEAAVGRALELRAIGRDFAAPTDTSDRRREGRGALRELENPSSTGRRKCVELATFLSRALDAWFRGRAAGCRSSPLLLPSPHDLAARLLHALVARSPACHNAHSLIMEGDCIELAKIHRVSAVSVASVGCVGPRESCCWVLGVAFPPPVPGSVAHRRRRSLLRLRSSPGPRAGATVKVYHACVT